MVDGYNCDIMHYEPDKNIVQPDPRSLAPCLPSAAYYLYANDMNATSRNKAVSYFLYMTAPS